MEVRGAGLIIGAGISRGERPGRALFVLVVTVLCLFPGCVCTWPPGSAPPGSAPPGSAPSALYRRLRRGWIWKQLFVPEEDPTPRVIGQLKSDYDHGDSSVRYILSGEGAGDAFQIDEFSGAIRTLRRLDREARASYELQAQALSRASGQPVEPQSQFIIQVQDVNDNAPRFLHEPYSYSVPEMCPPGTTVAQVTAEDADDPLVGNNAKLIYSTLQGEPYFSVEPKTGIIVTSWPNMDREAREQYLVVVQVKDMLGQSGGFSSTTTVTINLSDVNDNGPTFQHHQYTFAVPENAAVGTTVGRIRAEDGDVGVNARMNYSLQDLEESATFSIHTDPATQEGVVLLVKPLDYETKRRFAMTVEAANVQVDLHFLSLEESRDRTTLRVVVDDVDEPPVFLAPAYEWKIPESAAVGIEVGSVSARDADTASNPIRYSIDRGSDKGRAFRIDPSNGTLALSKPLDREAAEGHNVTLVATETKPGFLSSSVSVFIKVLDVNDNAPRLAAEYHPFICEGTPAGEVIQTLSAVDADAPLEGNQLYFSMVPEKHINPNFTIRDNQDNTAGVVSRRSTFTRKDRSRYLLPVVVADSGTPPLSSTSTLTVSVCSCQPDGRCPAGGSTRALTLALDTSHQILLGALLCLALVAALSILTLLLRRQRRRKPKAGGASESKQSESGLSQKVLRYTEPGSAGYNPDCSALPPPTVAAPLRHHPRRKKERRLRRAEVAASIRMSLRQSHVIGPEDEVFRQFILDRLDEADRDPYAPPFDCLRIYAYEGSGSDTGSLSSLASGASCSGSASGPGPEQPACSPRPHLVQLTPWYGGGDEETTF